MFSVFESPGLWNKFDLDYTFGKGDQLFRFISKFRYLAWKIYGKSL